MLTSCEVALLATPHNLQLDAAMSSRYAEELELKQMVWGPHKSLDKVHYALVEGVVRSLAGHVQHALHELFGICLRSTGHLRQHSEDCI